MTALDIITLLLVGIAGVLGFMRGFVSEALSLVAWVVAFAAVHIFQPLVSLGLMGYVGTEAGAAVLGFALVFGVTFIAGRMLAKSLGGATRKSLLGPVDRLLGLGFGALKGLLGAIILFLIVALAVDTYDGAASDRPAWMTQSVSYPLLTTSAGALVDMVKARQTPHRGKLKVKDEA
jgi:membrane protein required for colicin V production